MNKMNKKAWLRIVEVFLAILIIVGALLIFMPKQEVGREESEIIYERQTNILKIINKNNELRGQIIRGNNVGLNAEILKMVPSHWDFSTNICEIEATCARPGDYINKNIYVAETIITSNLTEYSPKKVKFFVWMK